MNLFKELKIVFYSLINGINMSSKENYIQYKKRNFNGIEIIGITRIKNEELIINDTLNHISQFVDGVIVLDDCSTDKTLEKVIKNNLVIRVLKNRKWIKNRIFEETHHRQMLLDVAREYEPKWIFYFDADERFEGNIKKELLSVNKEVDGIKISLFDAYITAEDQKNLEEGIELYGFRKKFGPEQRDILMLWRNKPYITFSGLDAREPVGCTNMEIKFFCQHYGKSISIDQWEDTCQYYATYFPEPYTSKWKSRMGKAVHEYSDFNNYLYEWEEVKSKGIKDF